MMKITDALEMQINVYAWTVAKTGKPIASIPLFREEARDVTARASEIAGKFGIHAKMVESTEEGADIEYPAVQLYLYREQIIFDTYMYLTNTDKDVPLDILDCPIGLLYGYRSDAIQQYVDGM